MPAAIAPAAAAVAPAVVPNGAAKPPAPVAPGGAKPGEAAAAAPEALFEVKIAGETKKFTRAEAERLLSKAGFADKVVQQSKEAIRAAKEAEARAAQTEAARRQRAKDNTDEWMREHGIDPDEFARLRLEKKVDEGKLTPDQKRALQAEQEAARLKGEIEKRDADRQAEVVKARTTQIQRHIEATLSGAAKKAGLEPGDTSFFAIYQALQEANDLGLLPEDGLILPHQADVLVDEAKSKIDGQFQRLEQAVLTGLTGESLLKRIGDKVASAVTQAMVARVRGSGSAAAPSPSATLAPPPPPPEAPVSGYLSEAEVDAKLRKISGGR